MRIVFLEPLGVEQSYLEDLVSQTLTGDQEIVYYPDRAEDTNELIKRSESADIVVLSNLPYKKEVMENCPNLKCIVVAFTGVDHVDMDYCRDKNITVCNCAGYSTVAVADLVFGLVLNLYRYLPACDKAVREGGTKNGLIGFELEGKKFGIIGAGAIGMRTAQIAKAFGCQVYASSRTAKNIEGITFVDMDTLLKECDIVSLHVPLNDSTRNLIGAAQLKLMKKSAILINTARGPVVNSDDLAQALKDDVIAGAGIDVFEIEPPIASTHPLFGAPHVVATPHVAFATKEAMKKRAVIVMEDLKAYLDQSPINIMN